MSFASQPVYGAVLLILLCGSAVLILRSCSAPPRLNEPICECEPLSDNTGTHSNSLSASDSESIKSSINHLINIVNSSNSRSSSSSSNSNSNGGSNCPPAPPCTAVPCVATVQGQSESPQSDSPCSNKTVEDALKHPFLAKIPLVRMEMGGTRLFAWDNYVAGWVFKNDNINSEQYVREAFTNLLGKGPSATARGDVMDIGANTGIYGVYAAVLGFRVFMYELQPMCLAMQMAVIQMNGVADRVTQMPFPVGRVSGTAMKVSPETPCMGHLRLSDSPRFGELTAGLKKESFYDVKMRRVDETWSGDQILLAKIDTEGNEAEVLAGMRGLFEKRKVKNIVIEISPVIWKEFGWDRASIARDLAGMWDFGFTDVTFLPISSSNQALRKFASKAELETFLATGDFSQNDFLFTLV